MKQAIYRHPEPGTVVTLFDEKGKEIVNPSTGRSVANFKDTGVGIDRCGIFRTSVDEIKKAVERSKPFKIGHIIKLKTEEEIALETKKQKQAEFREELKSLVKKGYFNWDELEKGNKDKLVDFCDQIGLEAEGTKSQLLADIKSVLNPGETQETEEKEDETN